MKQYFNKPTIIIAATSLIIGGLIGASAVKTSNKIDRWGNRTKLNQGAEDHDHMGMMMNMYEMSQGLKNETGDKFDRAYLEQMIVHHQGALDMSAWAEKNAKRQEVKTLAKSIIASQTAEIKKMQDWLNAWYK